MHGSCDGLWVVVIVMRGGDWNDGHADGGGGREYLYV